MFLNNNINDYLIVQKLFIYNLNILFYMKFTIKFTKNIFIKVCK